jgi:hypothetical protein
MLTHPLDPFASVFVPRRRPLLRTIHFALLSLHVAIRTLGLLNPPNTFLLDPSTRLALDLRDSLPVGLGLNMSSHILLSSTNSSTEMVHLQLLGLGNVAFVPHLGWLEQLVDYALGLNGGLQCRV